MASLSASGHTRVPAKPTAKHAMATSPRGTRLTVRTRPVFGSSGHLLESRWPRASSGTARAHGTAHHLERRASPGPSLERACTLAYEDLEAVHHPGAAGPGPALDRGRLRAVDQVDDHRRGSAPPRLRASSASTPPAPGPRPTEVAFTSTSTPGSAGPTSSACTTPSSAATAAARSGVRFQSATSAPASRSAHAAARPAPRRRARARGGRPWEPRGRR